MTEPDKTVVPFPAPLPSELEHLIAGIEDEAQRNAIIAAYYRTAQGDPESFPVAFATVTKALLTQQHRLASKIETLVAVAERAQAVLTGAGDFSAGAEAVKKEVRSLLNLQGATILAALGVAFLTGSTAMLLLLTWTGHFK
jgi:hypothetical protein